MSFFKRKERVLIPPVEESKPTLSDSSRSSYRSTPTTFNASRDGDLYGTGSYGRSQGNLDGDRRELLSGYNPDNSRPNKFGDRSYDPGKDNNKEPAPGEEQEEDVEGIRQQIRATKQETVSSSRNALRLAREAEETARSTLLKLGDQSEKLANTERHLDVTKAHTLRAEDHTDELKKLNRSIFRPAITFNKDAKRSAHEDKIAARYAEETEERERAMRDVRATQDRLGNAITYGQKDDEGLVGARGAPGIRKPTQDRRRFQFEATASDDEMEDELDGNLDELSDMTKRLKALGTSMGEELGNQTQRIERISDKATAADSRMFRNTEKLKRIK